MALPKPKLHAKDPKLHIPMSLNELHPIQPYRPCSGCTAPREQAGVCRARSTVDQLAPKTAFKTMGTSTAFERDSRLRHFVAAPWVLQEAVNGNDGHNDDNDDDDM